MLDWMRIGDTLSVLPLAAVENTESKGWLVISFMSSKFLMRIISFIVYFTEWLLCAIEASLFILV